MRFQSKKIKELGLKPIEKFHTPFMQLDFSLGKGFGEGVWIEAFAPEGLGKTTLMLQSIYQYLLDNDDSYLLLLDVEKALDYSLLRTIFFDDNVVIDEEENLIYINDIERGTILMPDTYDEIETVSEEFFNWCIKEKIKGVILWDSLVSAISKEVQHKGDGKIGYKATAIQSYIERFLSMFRKIPVTLFVINQIRDKIQMIMGQDRSIGGMIDGDYHVPGGKAHKFFAFQTLMLINGKKWQYSTTSDKLKGQIVKIIPTKNKQAPSKRQVDLVRIDDYGFSNVVSLIEFLKDKKVFSGTMGRLMLSREFTDKYGIKQINIETFVEKLINDDEFLDLFYEICYNYLLIHYKEEKRINLFDKNKQKENIRIDAIKMNKHLKFINENINKLELLLNNSEDEKQEKDENDANSNENIEKEIESNKNRSNKNEKGDKNKK